MSILTEEQERSRARMVRAKVDLLMEEPCPIYEAQKKTGKTSGTTKINKIIEVYYV